MREVPIIVVSNGAHNVSHSFTEILEFHATLAIGKLFAQAVERTLHYKEISEKNELEANEILENKNKLLDKVNKEKQEVEEHRAVVVAELNASEERLKKVHRFVFVLLVSIFENEIRSIKHRRSYIVYRAWALS